MHFDKERFEHYIETFNREEWDYLGDEFFTQDFVFEAQDMKLTSRAEVIELFKFFHQGIRETLMVNRFVINDHHIAAELTISFQASVDFPNFPVAPLSKGETLTNTWTAFYDLSGHRISRLAVFYWPPAEHRLTSFPPK